MSDSTQLVAQQAGMAQKTLEVDREIAEFLQAEVFREISAAVDTRLDEEIEDELGDARVLVAAGDCRNSRGGGCHGRYCRYVLRGEQCPFGLACRFLHFHACPDGAAPPDDNAVEREALCCGICGNLLATPVTLTCGHTFDRECLLRLGRSPRCPVDGQLIVSPLPEVDFTLRSYIDARFRPEELGPAQTGATNTVATSCTPVTGSRVARGSADDQARRRPEYVAPSTSQQRWWNTPSAALAVVAGAVALAVAVSALLTR